MLTLFSYSLSALPIDLILPYLCKGCPLFLSGPLGVGKTTLIRALIQRVCGIETVVPSPSFPILLPYPHAIWHADLYRIAHGDDILPLDLVSLMETERCVIEWPERLGKHTPKYATALTLSYHEDPHQRWLSLG